MLFFRHTLVPYVSHVSFISPALHSASIHAFHSLLHDPSHAPEHFFASSQLTVTLIGSSPSFFDDHDTNDNFPPFFFFQAQSSSFKFYDFLTTSIFLFFFPEDALPAFNSPLSWIWMSNFVVCIINSTPLGESTFAPSCFHTMLRLFLANHHVTLARCYTQICT